MHLNVRASQLWRHVLHVLQVPPLLLRKEKAEQKLEELKKIENEPKISKPSPEP